MFDEKQYRKEYYLKNKEKILARQKEMQKERATKVKERQEKYYKTKDGRITRLLSNARRRARDNNLECDLDLDFLRSIAPDNCPVFGFPLDWTNWGEMNQIANESSPSLDKINPNKGYTKENVIFLSWKANRLKSNATHEELQTLATWLKEFESKQNDRE